MKYIQPKNTKKSKNDWLLPEKTLRLVEHYAEYVGYSEEEVVEVFLENLIDDSNFREYIKTKRNNKRILKDLGLNENEL